MVHTNIKNYEKLLSQTTITHTVKNTLLASLLALITTPVFAVDNYQKNALLNPSDSLLKAEARGRIMIYDGLQIAMIDKAMDEQFDRIDSMMFVRTQHPMANGQVEVEDDGC